MAMLNIRPERWAKVTKDGTRIPKRCPDCRSRETVLAVYMGGEKFIECLGCYQVIKEVA